jgi:hypothetical protein
MKEKKRIADELDDFYEEEFAQIFKDLEDEKEKKRIADEKLHYAYE